MPDWYEDTSDEPTVTEAVQPVAKTIVAELPMRIAKAMKPIVCNKNNSPQLRQILCEPGPDLGCERTARYVGTNGCVLLIIDTNLPAPTDAQVFSGEKHTNPDTGKATAASDIELFISTKGYRTPEYFRAGDEHWGAFPDYKAVLPKTFKPVEQVGFDVSYMDMMLKIHKALGFSTSMRCWSVQFSGDLSPVDMTWETQHVDGIITRVQFIVMPMRID